MTAGTVFVDLTPNIFKTKDQKKSLTLVDHGLLLLSPGSQIWAPNGTNQRLFKIQSQNALIIKIRGGKR